MSFAEKRCLQLAYPKLQTPCFEAAGGREGDQVGCVVMDVVVLLKNMTGEKVTPGELRQIFHDVCVISMFSDDNGEYWERVSKFTVEDENE